MKILRNSVLVIVVLLSVSAGASKLMQLPHEVKFFQDAELSLTLLMVMGTAQWVGGLFLLIPKLRMFGAIIAAGSFLASTIVIFMTGQIGFGIFSLLPVALAGSIAIWPNPTPTSYSERSTSVD